MNKAIKRKTLAWFFLGTTWAGVLGVGGSAYSLVHSDYKYGGYMDKYSGMERILSDKEMNDVKGILDYVPEKERNWQYQYFANQKSSVSRVSSFLCLASLVFSLAGAAGYADLKRRELGVDE